MKVEKWVLEFRDSGTFESDRPETKQKENLKIMTRETLTLISALLFFFFFFK